MEPYVDDQGNIHVDQRAVDRAIREAADGRAAEPYIRSYESLGMTREAAEATYYGREGSMRLQEKRSSRATPINQRDVEHVGESEHSSTGDTITLRESNSRTPAEKVEHEQSTQVFESLGMPREAALFAMKGRAA